MRGAGLPLALQCGGDIHSCPLYHLTVGSARILDTPAHRIQGKTCISLPRSDLKSGNNQGTVNQHSDN